MENVRVVLDVSSDEEDEVVCLRNKRGRSIDFDWVKQFLDIADEELNEVALLQSPKKPWHKSKKSSMSAPRVDDDDDDADCVVLDCDPESRITTVDDSPSSTGSDELVVVGEKGQIACRDYPHPRHLCVKFPYSSTPHEKHCDQCHCYVCDSVAPCPNWGTGLLSADHCHATEKLETWRTLRKNFKLGKTAPLPASTSYSTLSDVGNSQQNLIRPLGVKLVSPNSMLPNQISMSTATHAFSPVNLIPQNQASRPIINHILSSPNPNFQNQVSRPNTVSISTNLTNPSGTNCGRYQQSGSTLARNRYQSNSNPQHSLGMTSRAIQRVQQHRVSNLGSQFRHSHTVLNGIGSVGVGSTMPVNHSSHGTSGGFSNRVNPAQQYATYHAATGFSNNRTCYGQNNFYSPQNLLSYSGPCSQPSNLSSVSNYTTSHETQASYQSNGSQNFYTYSVPGNNAPSSNVAGLSRNENACGNVTQSRTTRLYSSQQKRHDVSQIESALKADFSAIDSSRIEDTNKSLPYKRSSGSMNISSRANECSTQFTGVDDIKRWLFSDENSVPVGADGALASELNMASPDLGTIDGGWLFDFETSWDCLAHG